VKRAWIVVSVIVCGCAASNRSLETVPVEVAAPALVPSAPAAAHAKPQATALPSDDVLGCSREETYRRGNLREPYPEELQEWTLLAVAFTDVEAIIEDAFRSTCLQATTPCTSAFVAAVAATNIDYTEIRARAAALNERTCGHWAVWRFKNFAAADSSELLAHWVMLRRAGLFDANDSDELFVDVSIALSPVHACGGTVTRDYTTDVAPKTSPTNKN